jgi:hypothetical protein
LSATLEQIEFIRAHGITHCPPSPEWRVPWGGRLKRHGLRELSEADQIAMMATYCDPDSDDRRRSLAIWSRKRAAKKV